MAFDYAEIAAVAQELLEEFGLATTLTRQVKATGYTPATSTVTAATAVVDTVQAACFPVADRLINGTSIIAGDLSAILSAVGVTEPRPGDVLAWAGKSYGVVSCKNLAPGGVSVLYEAIVRSL